MSQIHLTDNHRDLSTNEGFQFEFDWKDRAADVPQSAAFCSASGLRA